MNPLLDNSIRLAPALQQLLDSVRRKIRAYVWAEGIAVLLIALGLCFWGTLGFDWVFEPPAALRTAILVAIAAFLAWVIFYWIVRRVWVRLADRSMAILLERRFHRLQDSLLTTVELSERSPDQAEYSAEMLADTQREALVAANDLPIREVFNLRPLIRRLALACLLLVSIVAFGVGAREAFGVWVRRSLLMSDELWPRRTHLSVEGFDDSGRIKIARGSDLNLVVRADADSESVVPEIVEVRYTAADGVRGRENMSREGAAQSGVDPYQTYTHTFKGLLAGREFYIVGGDDRLGPLHVDVVDSPTISRMTLRCEYPSYTRRASREVPVSGLMQLPMGTTVTVLAEANKPLVQVQVDDSVEDGTPVTHKLQLDAGSAAKQRFEFPLPPLRSDKTLLFTLLDTDGIKTREPIRLALAAAPDEPPRVNVALKGIGTAITPSALLPAAGEIIDDYGVARAWFDLRVDAGEPKQNPIDVPAGQPNTAEVRRTLEVEPMQLEPKQKLHLAIQAEDNFALETPNVGAGQKYVLDVVTPEQLRSMLEARELMLRRRFETIIDEMTSNRDSLVRIDFGSPSASETAAAQANSAEKPQGAVEPGDEQGGRPVRRENPNVQIERALQNAQRSAHETLGVAQSFDDICDELVNNRVDTEELKSRLRDGIATPLKRLTETRFPELNTRLKRIQNVATDPAAALEARKSAEQEADAILVEMKQVLDRMLELESFNEALDLLRDIIATQEKISEDTKQRQKSKLRDLLEE